MEMNVNRLRRFSKRRISVERADGTATQYIYDGWQVAQEIEDGMLIASYIYNDGIDNPVTMVRDGNTYFYHTDTRNNVSMMTNEGGTVVERYEYDPYGSVKIKNAEGVEIAESVIVNNYLSSSRRYDIETGLYYYRHRTYSSELGRFLQRDPLWYEDGMNLYGYVGDNPIYYYDPYGLDKGKIIRRIFEGTQGGAGTGVRVKTKVGPFKFEAGADCIFGSRVTEEGIESFNEERVGVSVKVGPFNAKAESVDGAYSNSYGIKGGGVTMSDFTTVEFGATVPHPLTGNAINLEVDIHLDRIGELF